MTKKIAFLGLFCALATILGYVEALIPLPIGIPGVKIGLANLSVLYLLQKYSWREAAFVSLIRILIIGFLFGSLFGILYSLCGAAFSLLVMTLLSVKKQVHLPVISIAGGIAHNAAQLAVALWLTRSIYLLSYAPVLLLSGIAAGALIGFLTAEVSARIR